MSEILTINTTDSIPKQESLELPIYDENFYMLRQIMPEYTEPLPSYSISNIAQKLKATMVKYSGIGLSANQCGVQLRAFVIGTSEFQMFCLNPKIVGVSENTTKVKEGCLSFPGLSCLIERPETIKVEYLDENGNLKQDVLSGITARCFQHELDHLNGVRFIDHIGSLSLKMAREKQKKLIKKIKRK
jgi:peptide deformylase